MKYDIVVDENKRIGIFSDIHIGVDADSKVKLQEMKKCVKWIIDTFKENKVDWILFCGDLFNSRYSINVNTLNAGIEVVQDLSYNFEKVILIEGNHDTYYKNSNSVNSVTFLSNLSKNDNIIIVDERPKFIKVADTILGLYPGGFEIEQTAEIEDFKTPDYGFGHFELNGIESTGNVSSGNKYNLQDMLVLGNELFSGHYHKNKLYMDPKSKKVLHMIGSCLQLNWGEYNDDKKIGVLDTSNRSFVEYSNTVNARFEKVFYSGLKNKKYTADILKTLCKKNYIKFVIDLAYKFDDILKCSDLIKKLNPMSLEFDYIISSTAGLANDSVNELDVCKSKTNDQYLNEYLESVFEEYSKNDDSYDLVFLKSLADAYYKKSMLPKNEREEQELEE